MNWQWKTPLMVATLALFRTLPSSVRHCLCGPGREDWIVLPEKSVIPLFDRMQHHSSVLITFVMAAAAVSGARGWPNAKRTPQTAWHDGRLVSLVIAQSRFRIITAVQR